MRFITAALILITAAFAAAPARADVLLPPAGKVLAGVTGGLSVDEFARQTGRRPAVFQFFISFGDNVDYWFAHAAAAHARPMLHISTVNQAQHEIVTPGQIAAGREDRWLVQLNRAIKTPTYIRLMAEMDGHWNPYCAYGPDGRPRGSGHSTAAFRAAWRRVVIIVRGRDVAASLRRAHLAPLRADAATLHPAQVAFLWVPQVAGAPDIAGNAPRAYWPGAQYVDWVGTDFYSKFPNWNGLDQFYNAFGGKPFVFGEWALWGSDDPAFVHELFGWMRRHARVRMAMYNQGNNGAGPFRLKRYPRARRALASELRAPLFAA